MRCGERHQGWPDSRGRALFGPDCGGPELELSQTVLRESTGAPNARLGSCFDARVCVHRGCVMPRVFYAWGE